MFIEELLFYYVLCMGALSVCMAVYHIWAECLQRPEEGIRCAVAEVPAGCEHPHEGTENQSWVPAIGASTLNHRAISPSPFTEILVEIL